MFWIHKSNSLEFSINVFTEFSDKNIMSNKRMDCCARTCYLLGNKPVLYLSVRKSRVTEMVLKFNPIHASGISQIL